MSEHEASRGLSAAFLRPLATVLTRQGGDGDAFLAEVGLRAEMPADTYAAGDLVDRALARIAAECGDPVFGLTLARIAGTHPLGLFGHMVWLSGSIRDVVGRASRLYAAVSRRTRIEVEHTTDRVVMRQSSIAGAARGQILTEFAFASFALHARAATNGRFRLRTVAFRHPGAPHPAYQDVFLAPLEFGSQADEVVFDPAQLDLALSTADPLTSSTLEAAAERLASDDNDRGLLAQVERTLAKRIDKHPTLDEVARELGVSARTVRRRLRDRGTSFRGLVDETRRRYADEMLARGCAMKEIAFALGFSDPSAFSRAYKRWTGRARNTKRP